MAAVPTTAIAPPFRNVRRVMLMRSLISLALKFRRAQQQSRYDVDVGRMRRILELRGCLGSRDLLLDRLVRLFRDVARNQRLFELELHLVGIGIDSRLGRPAVVRG